MNFLNRLSKLMGKYYIVLILVASGFAMAFPAPFLAALKVKVFNQSLITLGLGLVMFAMGVTLRKEDFQILFTRPKDIFIGCLAQFTIMPMLAYTLAKTFNLPPALAVGLILLGTCPGGTASNVVTYLAKGDVAVSIGMTSVSTLLSALLTPVLTYLLAGQWIKIDVMVMVLSILKIVVFPIAMGVTLNYFFRDKVEKFKDIVVMVPIASIIFIMGLCVAPNKENLLNASFSLVLAVFLHNWLGYLFGYLVGALSGMNLEKKKALSIEVGLQNGGLAVGLATQFTNPLTILPATLATVLHQLSGSILASFFARETSLLTSKRQEVKL